VVEKLGPGVTALKVGEPVFSTIGRGGPAGLNGGYSEFVVAPADNVVAKPKKLTYAEAAGLGTVGATAARVINQAKVAKGQRVLVTGVAGGVGSSAAQIATALGAYVLGTASPRHNAYLKTIGVNEVIDYTQGNWADKARNVDVVIDTVGGDTALTALGALRKGGTYVSVASRDITPDKCAAAGVNCAGGGPPGPAGPSEGDLLRQVAQLANEGKFKVNIDRTYPLANAADAQEYNRQGHTEGKVILIVDAAEADKK
jgi:NADPH:quinone reductase-like Zn-dependent oxidoreductase